MSGGQDNRGRFLNVSMKTGDMLVSHMFPCIIVFGECNCNKTRHGGQKKRTKRDEWTSKAGERGTICSELVI
jgi:hypothetical protein